ncbi:MAG: YncE family protein [Gemmatimonadota bacterium]|nr:MAG: YncE family protein [Gemmatimonadota bacterium]
MRTAPLTLSSLLVAVLAFGSDRQADPADNGGLLLVTNKSGNSVSFIEPASGREVAQLEAGPNPHEVAVTPDGQLAFVANYGSNSLTVVDVPGRAVLGMVDLGEHSRPHGVVVSQDGASVWVTTEGSKHLVEVDVSSLSVTRAIRTDQEVTHMVALAEGKGKAYTANIGSGNVTAIDVRSGEVIGQIETGAGAEGIAVTLDEEYVLVTNRAAGTLSVIDVLTDDVIHSMEIGGFPIRVEVTPDGRRALVSQAQARTLTEIELDGWTVTRTLAIGAFPVGIEIRPDGKAAYVANTLDNMLTVVDLESFDVAMTIPAGAEPDGMAWVGS